MAFAAAPTYGNGSVSFSLADGGALPGTVRVDLSALPGGITFDPSTLDCALLTGTSALCQTGTTTSYTLPLAVPLNQGDTVVTLTLSADGVLPVFDTFSYNGVTDVSLSPLTPANPLPGTDGRYHVTTTLHGVANLDYVDLSATGATIESATGCVLEGGALRCHGPVEGQSVDLVLSAPADVATPFMLTVTASSEYDELAPGDNTVGTDLQPAPIAPFAFDGQVTATEVGGTSNDYLINATISGLPAGSTSVELRLARNSGSAANWTSGSTSAGSCTVNRDVLTCTYPEDTKQLTVSSTAVLPGGGNRNFELTATVGSTSITQLPTYLP